MYNIAERFITLRSQRPDLGFTGIKKIVEDELARAITPHEEAEAEDRWLRTPD